MTNRILTLTPLLYYFINVIHIWIYFINIDFYCSYKIHTHPHKRAFDINQRMRHMVLGKGKKKVTENVTEKKRRKKKTATKNFKYNDHWGKVHLANWSNKSQEISPLQRKSQSCFSLWLNFESSHHQLFLPEKKRTWRVRGSKVTLFSQAARASVCVCVLLWTGSSSAVGSEVRLQQGRRSRLLFDVVTARAVALLVWCALGEGELVHLWSLLLYLQRGLWTKNTKTKRNKVPIIIHSQ